MNNVKFHPLCPVRLLLRIVQREIVIAQSQTTDAVNVAVQSHCKGDIRSVVRNIPYGSTHRESSLEFHVKGNLTTGRNERKNLRDFGSRKPYASIPIACK